MSKKIGDITCGGNKPEDTILTGDTVLDVGFGRFLFEDGKCLWSYIGGVEDKDAPTLSDLEKVFGHYFGLYSMRYRLKFYGPLHDETFEYGQDGKWHLIQQGRGFA